MLKLALLFLTLMACMPFTSFSQVEVSEADQVALMENNTTVSESIEAPSAIQSIIVWVATIPKIGPVIVTAFKYLVTIAGVFTALSIAVSGILLTLSGVLKVPQVIALWSGSLETAEKFEKWSIAVKKFNDKIQPYLKYLSTFNAIKK